MFYKNILWKHLAFYILHFETLQNFNLAYWMWSKQTVKLRMSQNLLLLLSFIDLKMLWFTTCREAGLLRLPPLSTNFALNIPWWAFWTVTLVTCCNSTCVTHTQLMTSMSTQSCWARAMGKAAALQPVQQWVALCIHLKHTQMNNINSSWHDYLIHLLYMGVTIHWFHEKRQYFVHKNDTAQTFNTTFKKTSSKKCMTGKKALLIVWKTKWATFTNKFYNNSKVYLCSTF